MHSMPSYASCTVPVLESPWLTCNGTTAAATSSSTTNTERQILDTWLPSPFTMGTEALSAPSARHHGRCTAVPEQQ